MKGKFGVLALVLTGIAGMVISFLVVGDKSKLTNIFKKKTQ